MTIVTSRADKIETNTGSSLPVELQQVLSQFDKVFEVLTRLPPRRKHDHKIPLVDET